MNTASIVSKVWSFCNTLRDDGVSYGDYLEQLTYLLFLKMADEYAKPPYNRKTGIPFEYDWQSLRSKRGADLEAHYLAILRELGQKKGLLGQIFTKAQNKIQDPAKLLKIITMIDDENWVMMGVDVKGDIYEGLLEKNAEDTKSGALIAPSPLSVDYVLANPPFGKKSSLTFTNEDGEQDQEDLTYNRQDFWATTSNKQLNFVQHIRSMLKSTGKAAVVVPDNVLFEGGAGETVRKQLLLTTDLHTILRLPTGVFYKQGVKANVIFFDNKPAAKDPWTKAIWFYDFRTNIHFTLKKNPLKPADLEDFITCYHPQNRHQRNETYSEENPEGRWRKFTYDEIMARDKTSLDIFWLKDKSLTDLDNLPDPDVLALEIMENLEAGLESFRTILGSLEAADT